MRYHGGAAATISTPIYVFYDRLKSKHDGLCMGFVGVVGGATIAGREAASYCRFRRGVCRDGEQSEVKSGIEDKGNQRKSILLPRKERRCYA